MFEVVEALLRLTDTPFRRAAGIALGRHIVRAHMKAFYQALNQDKPDIRAAALRVLTALVQHSTPLARELVETFNFAFAVRVSAWARQVHPIAWRIVPLTLWRRARGPWALSPTPSCPPAPATHTGEPITGAAAVGRRPRAF